MSIRREKSRLIVSLLGFLCTALSFLLMPAMPDKAEGGWLRVLPGLLFWGGLLTGLGAQLALSAQRRRWAEAHPAFREADRARRPGVIAFFRNTPGKISDLALAVSAVGVAVCLLAGGNGLAPYAFLALTFFSFCSHCIFNGKNVPFILELEASRSRGTRGRHQEGRVGQ